MFNENSAMVKSWVRLIQGGAYNREDVPKLSNLQEVVYKILDQEV